MQFFPVYQICAKFTKIPVIIKEKGEKKDYFSEKKTKNFLLYENNNK